ncbi:hypothetical protein [Lactiplantibacillus mudanjiangensis]|uniref:Mor transcription activator domain-containing protein n=1 Tax=Lactiplantibacillus mudanjiangensis TaxID=1296538 RepID=A0A660E659_9LACO|nr:hypothetical protein [Lactiplantibacillus mudanjiangensis]VDG24132.1 hypothetical protein [Lactobacillus pentosus] [Lactiplantibacillus mudanjiangensis]VDG30309.1 hypothetical protein [Lactobacillus pentosus] [Lactiplantibacillus mudanjiangensis]
MTLPTDSQAFHSLMHAMSDLIGLPATMQFFEQYRGMRLNIPAHLYDSAIVATRISQLGESRPNSQVLAAKYGYSRRWVDQVLRTAKRSREAVSSH